MTDRRWNVGRTPVLLATIVAGLITGCGDIRRDPVAGVVVDAAAAPADAPAVDTALALDSALDTLAADTAAASDVPLNASLEEVAPADTFPDDLPAACRTCPSGPHATAICTNGACDYVCDEGTTACEDVLGKKYGCHPTRWNFEAGDAEGWTSTGFPDSAVVGPYTAGEQLFRSGKRSLTAELRASHDRYTVEFDQPALCPPTTRMNRRGRVLGAWLHVAGAPTGSEMRCRIYGWSAELPGLGSRHLGQTVGPLFATGTWVRLETKLDENEAAALVRVLIHCFLPRGNWQGRAHLDDVTIE